MDELREKKGRRGRKERAKRGELDDEALLVGEIEQDSHRLEDRVQVAGVS